jgi:hypothetical protein
MEKVHGAPARWQAELAAGSLIQASAKGPQREGGARMADLRARRIVQLLPSSWQPLIRSLTDTINNDHMHGLPED